MKLICRRFHIKTIYFLRYAHVRYVKNLKFSLLLKKLKILRANNSRILRIKNTKFSGYCFDMNKHVGGF